MLNIKPLYYRIRAFVRQNEHQQRTERLKHCPVTREREVSRANDIIREINGKLPLLTPEIRHWIIESTLNSIEIMRGRLDEGTDAFFPPSADELQEVLNDVNDRI